MGEYFNVRIKYTVWSSLYGEQRPYQFSTLEAALKFAENNVSPTRPMVRVFDTDDVLVKTFTTMALGENYG